MTRWVRALLTTARIHIPRFWKVYLAAVSLIVSVVGFFVSSAVGPVALVLFIGSLAAAVSDLRTERRRLNDLYSLPATHGLASIRVAPEYESFERLALKSGVALTCDEVNGRLTEGEFVSVDVRPVNYRLPAEVAWAYPLVLAHLRRRGGGDFEAKKVRLVSDLLPGERWDPVVVQPTKYLYSAVTNDVAMTEFHSREAQQVLLGPSAITFPGGGLPSLANSDCSNHIGVSALGVTRAGDLVLVVQSHLNAHSRGLLASSGSGSADWADLIKATVAGTGFLGFLRAAMSRELAEECGLSKRHMRSADCIVLGFGRMVHRGGKPEFFGLMPLDATRNDLRRTLAERRFVEDHGREVLDLSSANALVHRIRSFVCTNQEKISGPLHVNLELMARWVEREPKTAVERLRQWAPDISRNAVR